MRTSRLTLATLCCLSLTASTLGRDADPVGRIATDSPRGVVLRLEQAYEALDLEGYTALMAADFRYRSYSPDFMERFPDGMTREDEHASARRLFHGDSDAPRLGVSIQLTLGSLEVLEDPLHPGEDDRYRLVVAPGIALRVIDGERCFEVIGTRQEFHVVRGDAADLVAGQRSDADHWYVWKWDEYPPGVASVVDRTQGHGPPRLTPDWQSRRTTIVTR